MESTLELYYSPGSYFSQKAYLTLLEKELSFTERLVFIGPFGEQNQDWFLKLNPAGLVPVIKDGDDVICESESIIDNLDWQTDSGSQLVPEADIALGQRVSDTRKWLYEVPIDDVTYGLLLHPGLRAKSTDYLGAWEKLTTKKGYERYLQLELVELRERQQRHCDPVVRGASAAKIERYQRKLDTVFEESHVAEVLKDLQQTFDRIDEQLGQVMEESSSKEVWLCGTTFTAADITMAVLFNRLAQIGVDEEYYSATKRPRVAAYRDRIYSRPTVQTLLAETCFKKEIALYKAKMVKVVARTVAKITLGVGMVAVIAFGVKKFLVKR